MVESLQPSVYACILINLFLACLAIGLRFYSRMIQKAKLWFDDYLAILALTSALAYNASAFFLIHKGLGLHLPDLPISVEEAQYYQALIQEVQEHTYSIAIGAAQLSLLALYWRLFKTNMSARVAILILTGFTIFIAVFQCIPPHFFWNKTVDGICTVDPAKFFIGSVSAHLVLDVALMIVPATQVSQLAIPFAQKIAVGVMFMFGVVICAASIMMIHVSFHYNSYAEDVMWNCVPAVNWSAAEIHLSIVACCLPMLRPVIRGLGGWLGHNFSTRRGHTGGSTIQLSSLHGSEHRGKAGDSTHNLASTTHMAGSNGIYNQGEESETFSSLRESEEGGHREVNLRFSRKGDR
ncbi:integral membrane protein [Dactylonectria macrodidyma]|uniref:Integral membrane protein n=1 Tax=Dactylonectria macrodidyma TaxID=307937 RepID=A0A9P9J185_9HYPO|nr:integral membrane protein [Dactylonectria macrodidyma]